MNTQNFLQDILAYKATLISQRKKSKPIARIRHTISNLSERRPFVNTIVDKINQKKPAIIAELKKASPSKGVINDDFDPITIAVGYQLAGATCLSVLTEEKYFQGHDEYLKIIKECCSLPLLRKDFIIDEYQVYETKALGADCMLLIAAALDDQQLKSFCDIAGEIGIDILIEVHNKEELDRVLPLNTKLIGINNRDLETFKTELNTTIELLPFIPDDRIVITESGIHSAKDIKFMQDHNVHAFLIGEALMRTPNPGAALEKLLS